MKVLIYRTRDSIIDSCSTWPIVSELFLVGTGQLDYNHYSAFICLGPKKAPLSAAVYLVLQKLYWTTAIFCFILRNYEALRNYM